ncbi:MAG: type II toxin-antitoxin system VapC family toxin [Methylococcales bacterium]
MTVYVLDACAVLAVLNDELGADRVEVILSGNARILMSAVNALEVCYDRVRRTGSAQQAKETLDDLLNWPMELVFRLDEDVLLSAAIYKSKGRIALADCIALALAHVHGAALVTADHHEFDPFDEAGFVRFEWIR